MGSNPIGAGAQTSAPFLNLTRPPTTHFSVGDVPAPTALYIGDDAFLRVTVKSLTVASTLTVRTRLLRSDDGQITTSEDTLKPGQTGAQQVFFVNLTEGFLLSAIVTADGGTMARGSMFVSVEVCHGNSSNVHRDALLIQDYVATAYAASWPGGMVRLSTEGPGASTLSQNASGGPGVDTISSFPANQRVRFISANVTFTASAAVANRFIVFNLLTGASVVYSVGVSVAITASQVANISLGAGIGGPAVVNGVHILPIPSNLVLIGSPSITTTTTGIQALDSFGIITVISETWIDA